MKLSIIHLSKAQPEEAIETYAEWTLKASNQHPYEYILTLNANDQWLYEYQERFKGLANILIHEGNNDELVQSAADYSSGELILILRDGDHCNSHWDKALLGACSKHTPMFDLQRLPLVGLSA